jgi:SOS-response transcriptional repressor LexA
MATRRDRSDEIKALASRIHDRMLEYEQAAPGATVALPSTISRILEHAADREPSRPRKEARKRGASVAPSIFTVHDAARRLRVPICAFFDEPNHVVLTEAQRKIILQLLLQVVDTIVDEHGRAHGGATISNAVPFDARRVAELPLRPRARSNVAPQPANILPSLTGAALFSARVEGRAMEPVLYDGDGVLIDTSKTTPRDGDVVVVDHNVHGAVIGAWRRIGKNFFLDQANDVRFTLGEQRGWRIVGTITRIVDAPLRTRT